MKVYKVTYKAFGPFLYTETTFQNVRADNEIHAIERLKRALKTNGHRVIRIIDVVVNNNPYSVMSDKY